MAVPRMGTMDRLALEASAEMIARAYAKLAKSGALARIDDPLARAYAVHKLAVRSSPALAVAIDPHTVVFQVAALDAARR